MNLAVESSLATWLRALDSFDGLAIHTGQSNDEIPQDQPVLIVGCETVEIIAGALSRATASIVIATPAHLDLDQHRSLVGALRSNLSALHTIAPHFAGVAFAGAVLTSLSESQSDNRWICTATLVIGIGEI